jgi:hypothetical protein
VAISTGKNQVWCASPDWSTSSTTGWRIPTGQCVLNVRRVAGPWRDRPFDKSERYGELNGLVVPDEDRTRMMAERGYLVPYFRKMFWTREKFEEQARKRGRI